MASDVGVAYLREGVKGSRSLRSDFEKADIQVFDLAGNSRYQFGFLSRLASLVKQTHPDILHTHLPRADIAGALIYRYVRLPIFLCSVHGIYRDRWFGKWAAPWMRRGYRKAGAVIAISSAVKNWLQQDYGIDDESIRVIHYGIEAERFVPPGDGRESALEKSSRFIVGSIGRLETGKGFDCLIRAMKIVHEYIPDACLMVAGHDPLGYGKRLADLIAELGLTEQVRLVGFQSDVLAFLNRVDVFAFASRSEGFGQVVIEAMAAGKPVVASNIAPLTEIVKHGGTGFLANPGDPQAFASAIVSLLSHPEMAIQMGRQGQQRVYDRFSAQRMVDETLDLYNFLLSSVHDGVGNAH